MRTTQIENMSLFITVDVRAEESIDEGVDDSSEEWSCARGRTVGVRPQQGDVQCQCIMSKCGKHLGVEAA